MNVFNSMLIGLVAVALSSCASGEMAAHDASASSPLAQEVRRATERYQDVTAATGAGYALFLGCVTSPQGGAMGIHYVNNDLVGDGKLDASRPEALMYEPKGGKLELVGVEYIVIAAARDAANKTPPTLMGMASDHLESWRIFPAGDEPGECVLQVSLYAPEPADTAEARREWARRFSLLFGTVDAEDFAVAEAIQRGLAAGAQTHFTFGRHEPALAHFHRAVAHELSIEDTRRSWDGRTR